MSYRDGIDEPPVGFVYRHHNILLGLPTPKPLLSADRAKRLRVCRNWNCQARFRSPRITRVCDACHHKFLKLKALARRRSRFSQYAQQLKKLETCEDLAVAAFVYDFMEMMQWSPKRITEFLDYMWGDHERLKNREVSESTRTKMYNQRMLLLNVIVRLMDRLENRGDGGNELSEELVG